MAVKRKPPNPHHIKTNVKAFGFADKGGLLV